MRRLMTGLLTASLLASTAARAQNCASSADQATFDVEALKSMMLVLATNCHEDQRYNAFVNRYKGELGRMEAGFDGYFKRTYGRRGQAEHDAYITQLANAQFGAGLKQGGDFCQHTDVIFDEAMSLRSGADLPAFAAGKDLVPESLGSCTAASGTPARGGGARHSSRGKRLLAGGRFNLRPPPPEREGVSGDAQRVVAFLAGVRRRDDAGAAASGAWATGGGCTPGATVTATRNTVAPGNRVTANWSGPA